MLKNRKIQTTHIIVELKGLRKKKKKKKITFRKNNFNIC